MKHVFQQLYICVVVVKDVTTGDLVDSRHLGRQLFDLLRKDRTVDKGLPVSRILKDGRERQERHVHEGGLGPDLLLERFHVLQRQGEHTLHLPIARESHMHKVREGEIRALDVFG